ncbi:hypothetical protein M0802_015474, partial [Mischocyttarus mexicanus]
CEYCKKFGHAEKTCWKKLGPSSSEQSGRTSPQFSNTPSKIKGRRISETRERVRRQTHAVPLHQNSVLGAPSQYQDRQRPAGTVTLMVDTTSDVNLIKTKALRNDVQTNATDIIELTGISPDRQNTLGTVDIEIFGEYSRFHIVRDDFPIHADGILGDEFFRSNHTAVVYTGEYLMVRNRKIPFAVSGSVCIPPRTSKIIQCYVINNGVKEGYIPQLRLPHGIYAGEALVTNNNGKANIKIINTTSRSVALPIPKIELLDFCVGTVPNSSSYTNVPESKVIDSDPSEHIHTLFKISSSSSAHATPKSDAPEPPISTAYSRADTTLARQNLMGAKVKSKIYYDRNSRSQKLLVGQNVYLLKQPTTKLGDQYSGPHQILEVLPKNNIKITYKNRSKIVHQDKYSRYSKDMYINVGGIITFISCLLPMTTALLGYDCGGSAANITTVSLLGVGDCNIPTTKPNRTSVHLQLLQLIDYETTSVFQCRVEVDRTIFYCGMSSHISAVHNGRRLYLLELSRDVCQTLIDTGSIFLNSFTHLTNIKTNTTNFRSVTLAGTLTTDGQCAGTQYSDTDGTWNNVVVQANVKINTKTYTGTVKIRDNIISLQRHLQCPFSKGSCFTDENGNAFWSTFPGSTCNFEQYATLYEDVQSIATQAENNELSEITIEQPKNSENKASDDQLTIIPTPETSNKRVRFKIDDEAFNNFKMSQDQRHVRSGTPLSDSDALSYENRAREKELLLQKKVEEVIAIQEKLSKIQIETCRKTEELDKREEELKRQKREVEQDKRRVELKEREIRRSLGADFDGFHGFERVQTPVGSHVTLSRTPDYSRPGSPQATPRRRSITPTLDTNEVLRAEIDQLKRTIETMRRAAPFALQAPSPTPRTSHATIKLREITENVPKFDGQNISVSQFTRQCRRA